jgi:3-hydroxybutyryl-CoA dehydrogenase
VRTSKDIKKIGVIGAGTMGRGIAQVFALYGHPVTLVDREEGLVKGAMEKVRERTEPELWDKVSNLIKTSTAMEEMKDCDLVIEAVFEKMDVKKAVFKALKSICKENTIIATNTSALSIDELSKEVGDPKRFIGMHFMNPPKVMKLVEVVRGDKTSDETVGVITALAKDIEKVPAVVKNFPGFVSNRLLFALIGEALRLFESGVAGKEDIDTVMKHGMNHPMGPIELADFIGLDICRNIMLCIYEGSGDERYRPPPILETLVSEGKLGRKTGEGFYRYA